MSFMQEQLEALKQQWLATNAAILAITTGGVERYKLDTGQSVQDVTKLDIEKLQKVRDSLSTEIAVLERSLNGTAVTIAGPCF